MDIYDINAKGGAAGYRFEAVFADDKSKPAYAGRLAEKLITKDKADFLIGVLSSEVAIKVTEVSRKYKKIFIGSAHSSSTLTIEFFQPFYFGRPQKLLTSYGGRLSLPQGIKTVSYTHLTLPTILRV